MTPDAGNPAPPDNSDPTKWLTSHAANFIESHNLVGSVLIVIASLAVGWSIIWVITSVLGVRKTSSEIKKTDAEATKAKLEVLQKLHEAASLHARSEETYNLLLADLIETIKSEPAKADRAREELIRHFCQDYLQTLGRYLDTYAICKDRGDCVQFVESVLLKQLKTAREFQDTVNLDFILKAIGNKAPLKITVTSLMPIWSFSKKNLRLWNVVLLVKVWLEKRKWPT